MKELSIEEKAKAYDEAIIRGSRLWESDTITRENYEYIFPELKESEDERIRKDLIQFFKEKDEEDFEEWVPKAKILAWLEKQGEHANFRNKIQVGDKVTRNKDGVLVNLSQLKRVAKPAEEYNITGIGSKHATGKLAEKIKELKPLNEILDKQGEQKPADLKTKAGNWYICDMEVMNENMVTAFHRDEIYYCPKDGYLDVGGALFEVGCLDVFRLATEKEIPQPKQEWSEEDERFQNVAINIFNSSKVYTTSPDKYEDTINWLKSLKDRVQPQQKQEWSEVDEYYLDSCITKIELDIQDWEGHGKTMIDVDNEIISWLKSLKERIQPQNTWKPSNEQMERLKGIIASLPYQEVLYSLYQDLKKLKG